MRSVHALSCALGACLAAGAWGAPSFVTHDPSSGVFGEAGDVTQREPGIPRESEAVDLWIKTGPSFSYDAVAVYYTLDGSPPAGTQGVAGNPSTLVLTSGAGQVAFVRNEPGSGGNDDWWVAELPAGARAFGVTVRYLVSAYGPGGAELFATDPSDGDNTFEFTNLIAWPGTGAGSPNPGEGYPQFWPWKEEGVVGNGDINAMIDQNGSVYDLYFPSAGAVRGVSTRNEGYYDGYQDQFPPSLSSSQTGQMHLSQAFFGLRPSDPVTGAGTTHWLTNPGGTDYAAVTQSYAPESNTITTTQTLVADGHDIDVVQTHFAPLFVPESQYPQDALGDPLRSWVVHEIELTNRGASPVEIDLYYYADWALNGGGGFDASFVDHARGAMVAYDNTHRYVNAVGEYNPTSTPDYEKDASVYLGVRMLTGNPGVMTDQFWSDTSSDQDRGWVGQRLTLAPNVPVYATVLLAGGHDPFAGATGTYDAQIAPVFDSYDYAGMGTQLVETDHEWGEWLDGGVRVHTPDPAYDGLFDRGLLGTALHLDRANGGIIAGMHNGAYPYVWPRDAAWAAITLARAGHVDDAERIYAFLRDVAERDVEGWGRKGFWKQKYTTDGQPIWTSPQVDETSCYPWGVRYLYDLTGDLTFLEDHYDEVYEAAISSSQDSTIDNRLRYEDSVDLMYSMSLWEDAFDVFNYSNASVIRGLEDAAAIADTLDQLSCPGGPGACNYHNDKALFESRASDIRAGLDARLAWDGENTDISQLGITYPFGIYDPGSARPQHILDRINGFATDAFGQNHPLVRDGSIPEWDGLVDRYWGDSYWNGGPWFLTTLWFGAYHAQRQDTAAGTADIDVHKEKIDLLIGHLGPLGLGAEQIASNGTLKYAGQTDYSLQTAYPNAWESMSFLTDAIMLFLDYRPDAPGNVLRVRPKLPSDWSFMAFDNLTLGSHRLGVRVELAPGAGGEGVATHTFTNTTGAAADFDTGVRVPAGKGVCSVTRNGTPIAGWTYDKARGTVFVTGALEVGIGATTAIAVAYGPSADLDGSGTLNLDDLDAFVGGFLSNDSIADLDGNGTLNLDDLDAFIGAFLGGCI